MDRSCRLIHHGGKGLGAQFRKIDWQRSEKEQAGIKGDAGLHPDPDGLLMTEDKVIVWEFYSGNRRDWGKAGNLYRELSVEEQGSVQAKIKIVKEFKF